uniref:Uncharacterized protein n=1 Tax=Anguilla anguilla TaxID=7936 RepID=A0A0E9XV42_ANGAN
MPVMYCNVIVGPSPHQSGWDLQCFATISVLFCCFFFTRFSCSPVM